MTTRTNMFAILLAIGFVSGRIGWLRADDPPADRDDHDDVKTRTDLVTSDAAARRLICLTAIYARGSLEADVDEERGKSEDGSDARDGDHQTSAKKLNAWLKRERLWDSLSLNERKLLSKKTGAWSQQEVINASWRAEAIGVIAWALKLQKRLPAYDTPFDPASFDAIPVNKATGDFIKNALLRKEATIRDARDTAELWLWRARTSDLQERPEEHKLPDGMTFEQIIAMAAEHAEKDGLFQRIGGDFPARGKPYRKLNKKLRSELKSIASERLQAFNWLCGYSDDWDEVPTDT